MHDDASNMSKVIPVFVFYCHTILRWFLTAVWTSNIQTARKETRLAANIWLRINFVIWRSGSSYENEKIHGKKKTQNDQLSANNLSSSVESLWNARERQYIKGWMKIGYINKLCMFLHDFIFRRYRNSLWQNMLL